MQFNSWEFLWFTLIMLVLYWLFRYRKDIQNSLLLIGSYYFYSRLHLSFPFYLAALTLVSYGFGRWLQLAQTHRKAILTTGIVLLSSCLVLLKYSNFGIGILNQWGANFRLLQWIVPVGLSFYTFGSIGYITDVYRKHIAATNNLVTYGAYLSFFPHLLAGPIPSAKDILPQFHQSRYYQWNNTEPAVREIIWGLFKKMVIADNISIPVNYCFAHTNTLNSFSLYIGIVLFSFQIYADFSGYSDIARGVARFFGIELFQNFKSPFLSRNPAEFWRRWHSSLTKWITDYLYKPLGGQKLLRGQYVLVLLFIFFFSGLWHGANWTFVCWGLLNGIYFLLYLWCGQLKRFQELPSPGRIFPEPKTLLQILLTFHLITFSRILFKSNSLTQAADYFVALTTRHEWRMPPMFLFHHVHWCVLLVLMEWSQRFRSHPLDIKANWGMRVLLYAAVIVAIVLFHKQLSLQEYYYFRF